MVKATSVNDVDQHEIVGQIAGLLKKSGRVKFPEWCAVVKFDSRRSSSQLTFTAITSELQALQNDITSDLQLDDS
ncbi:hypothetical protein AB6A40_008088 [Gnathostoma spinigerum]|uniref:Uncharacterized protein n=1 Tax=Gnathostoma spinigerum TaxID=75299 RepID=A0ABD6EVU2_9BILA